MARLIHLVAACSALAALSLTACGGGSDSLPPIQPVAPAAPAPAAPAGPTAGPTTRNDNPPPTQRETALGVVVGNDDSAAS